MLQPLITGLLLTLIYLGVNRQQRRRQQPTLRWWHPWVFALAPALALYIITNGVLIFGFPQALVFLGYSLYFLMPYYGLRWLGDCSPRGALAYALWVPVVAIPVEWLLINVVAGALTG